MLVERILSDEFRRQLVLTVYDINGLIDPLTHPFVLRAVPSDITLHQFCE